MDCVQLLNIRIQLYATYQSFIQVCVGIYLVRKALSATVNNPDLVCLSLSCVVVHFARCCLLCTQQGVISSWTFHWLIVCYFTGIDMFISNTIPFNTIPYQDDSTKAFIASNEKATGLFQNKSKSSSLPLERINRFSMIGSIPWYNIIQNKTIHAFRQFDIKSRT